MEPAKLFINGNSQAVRLPKEFRFSGSEVYAQKVGGALLLLPKDKVWETFVEGLNGFSPDFLAEGRANDIDVPREDL
ncbi:MAG: type II toxin-antitoxin system VapB family antitoxin [Oscillospiraceae bacterium]|nr:type II toxin-antitoxin system VapB family antitoxin [Oscillospiraceae bacterium]